MPKNKLQIFAGPNSSSQQIMMIMVFHYYYRCLGTVVVCMVYFNLPFNLTDHNPQGHCIDMPNTVDSNSDGQKVIRSSRQVVQFVVQYLTAF